MNRKWDCKVIPIDDGLTAQKLAEAAQLCLDSFGTVYYEVHADGVKEVPCDFCEEACRNDWCPTKEEK